MHRHGHFTAQMELAAMRLGGSPIVGGTSGERLDAAPMAVPAAVRLGPARLEWVPGREDQPQEGWWRHGAPARSALLAFTRLATEPEDVRFVTFAERYGVLGLTAGAMPCVSPHVPGVGGPEQLQEPWHGWAVSWEPIPAWRIYAQNAKAVMHLATRLRQDGRVRVSEVLSDAGLCPDWERNYAAIPAPTWGTDADKSRYWTRLQMFSPSIFVTNMEGKDLGYQRRWLASWVTHEWIGQAALTPTILWEGACPEFCLPVGDNGFSENRFLWPDNMLFNVLAVQLATFLCSGGEEPSARCDRCRRLYVPKAAPRSDRPNYCPRCRDERNRERKKVWARHKRSQRVVKGAAIPTPIGTPKPADDGG